MTRERADVLGRSLQSRPGQLRGIEIQGWREGEIGEMGVKREKQGGDVSQGWKGGRKEEEREGGRSD